MEDVIATVKKQTKSYQRYSNEQKLLFVYYNRIKLFNAAKSGRLVGGISERTAQKWAKKLKEDKDWNIFEKQTNWLIDQNHNWMIGTSFTFSTFTTTGCLEEYH